MYFSVHTIQYWLLDSLLASPRHAVLLIAESSDRPRQARHQGGKKIDPKYFEKNGGNLGGNGSSMLFGGARWVRYQQSKLAATVITKGLEDHFGDSGIKATVAHPGLAATSLQVTTASTGGMGSDYGC